MLRYILKRIALMLPTLFGILTITFGLIQLLPGGPVEQFLEQTQQAAGEASGGQVHTMMQTRQMQAQHIEALNKLYGFDQPWHTRYYLMLKNYAQFNLGESYFQQASVLELIKSKLPVSISLGICSFLLLYSIAIPLGIYKAQKSHTWQDTWSTFILLLLHAIPSFVLGVLFLVLFSGGNFWQLFPLRGLSSYGWADFTWWQKIVDYAWHLVLPLAAMVLGELALLTQLSKNNFLEEGSKHYVTVLRAQGLSKLKYYPFILKNALLPIVAGIPAALIAAIFAQSLLIENLFSLDGLGLLSYEAMLKRDYPVVLGSLYVFTLLGLFTKLLSDVLYVYLDPRIRLHE